MLEADNGCVARRSWVNGDRDQIIDAFPPVSMYDTHLGPSVCARAFMCAYVCVYTCVYLCMSVCVCVCVCVCLCVCLSLCLCLYLCLCLCLCLCRYR